MPAKFHAGNCDPSWLAHTLVQACPNSYTAVTTTGLTWYRAHRTTSCATVGGYEVVISDAQGLETLASPVEELTHRARAATAIGAAQAGDNVVVRRTCCGIDVVTQCGSLSVALVAITTVVRCCPNTPGDRNSRTARSHTYG